MAFFEVGKPNNATMHSSPALRTYGMSVSIKYWYLVFKISSRQLLKTRLSMDRATLVWPWPSRVGPSLGLALFLISII